MKGFILEENEEMLAHFSEVPVKANEKNFKLSVLLTNNRIILLKDESLQILMNTFSSSRRVDNQNELNVKLIIPLNEIKELKYIDGINKITFKDNNNKIDIKCINFKSYRIKLN